jgi:hypothetical protein
MQAQHWKAAKAVARRHNPGKHLNAHRGVEVAGAERGRELQQAGLHPRGHIARVEVPKERANALAVVVDLALPADQRLEALLPQRPQRANHRLHLLWHLRVTATGSLSNQLHRFLTDPRAPGRSKLIKLLDPKR